LYGRLVKSAQEHASKYAQALPDHVLVLVHPLFLHLNQMNCLKHGYRVEHEEDLAEYTSRLWKVLQSRKDDLGVLLWENGADYHATSLWLESGLADQTVITEYGSEELLKTEVPKARSLLQGKTVFLAGGYNGLCYKAALSEVELLCGEERVKAVSGLVIDGPLFNCYYLLSQMIQNSKDLLPSERLVDWQSLL